MEELKKEIEKKEIELKVLKLQLLKMQLKEFADLKDVVFGELQIMEKIIEIFKTK